MLILNDQSAAIHRRSFVAKDPEPEIQVFGIGDKRTKMSDFKDNENFSKTAVLQFQALKKQASSTSVRETLRDIEAKAESGDAPAQMKMGAMYWTGTNVPPDKEKAVYWLEKAAEQDYLDAQAELAGLYYIGIDGNPDYEKALYWGRKGADQGSDISQLIVGWCYSEGRGVEKDLRQAADWIRKAADQGNEAAQCELGTLYVHGTGVRQNLSEALEWFKKSAEQGYGPAMINYGKMFEHGSQKADSLEVAIRWYEKAAEAGESEAGELLADARAALSKRKEEEERRRAENRRIQEEQRRVQLLQARDSSFERTSVVMAGLFVIAFLLEQWAGNQEGKLSLLILSYAGEVICAAGAVGFGLASFSDSLGLPGAAVGAVGSLAVAVLSNTSPEKVLPFRLCEFAVLAVLVAVMIPRIMKKNRLPKP